MYLSSGRWVSETTLQAIAIDKIAEGPITLRNLINHVCKEQNIIPTERELNDIWRGVFQGEGFHVNHHTFVSYRP
jgi:hypothetical protein